MHTFSTPWKHQKTLHNLAPLMFSGGRERVRWERMVKLLKRLRLDFSHLNEHKFCHNFRKAVNPLCFSNAETETTSHYLLRCLLFSEQRTNLLKSLRNLQNTLLNHCQDNLVNIFLFGSSKYIFSTNSKMLSLTHLLLSF